MGAVSDARAHLHAAGFPLSKKSTIYAGVRSGFLVPAGNGYNWDLDWRRLKAYTQELISALHLPEGWVTVEHYVASRPITSKRVYEGIHAGAFPAGQYYKEGGAENKRIWHIDLEAADEYYGINKEASIE